MDRQQRDQQQRNQLPGDIFICSIPTERTHTHSRDAGTAAWLLAAVHHTDALAT
jgi:hypothetical protein